MCPHFMYYISLLLFLFIDCCNFSRIGNKKYKLNNVNASYFENCHGILIFSLLLKIEAIGLQY